MSLTWHIIRKDLRHLWPWVALLTVAILARYALGAYVEHHASPGPILLKRAEATELILLGLQLLIGALFAAQLLHEDTTNSDRAFWITRPISGLQLVSSKVLTLLLTLGVLPLLAVLTWWWLHDFRAAEIAASLPELAARQAALITGSFAVALFTRTTTGFILIGVLTYLLLGLQIAADTRWTLPVPPDLSNARGILCVTLAVLTLATCACLKYRRRYGRLPLILVAATMVAASAIGAWWPYDFVTAFRREPYSSTTAASIGLQLTVDAIPPAQSALFDFKFTNIPEAHRVEVRSLKLRLQTGENTFDLPFSSLALTPVHNAVAKKNVSPLTAPNRFTYRTALPPTPAPPASIEFTARATLRLQETVADIPIITGARAKSGASTTRITSVQSTFLPVRSVNILSVFPARQSPPNGGTETHSGYFLHDALRGEDPIQRTRRLFVIGGHSQSVDAMVVQDNLQIDHVRYVFENFHYKAAPDSDNDHLISVTYPLLGRFERTLTIPFPDQKSR